MTTPEPATTTATATASDLSQLMSRWRIRTCAKILGWAQVIVDIVFSYKWIWVILVLDRRLAANIYLIYAIVVALRFRYADGLHRQPDALGVLFMINGSMFFFGIFFEIVFLCGTYHEDMDDLILYWMFALFSIAFHLIALISFLILQAWMFAGLSVIPLALHFAGLLFAAAVFTDVEETEKRLLQQLIRQNQQHQLTAPPPPYSSLFV